MAQGHIGQTSLMGCSSECCCGPAARTGECDVAHLVAVKEGDAEVDGSATSWKLGPKTGGRGAFGWGGKESTRKLIIGTFGPVIILFILEYQALGAHVKNERII